MVIQNERGSLLIPFLLLTTIVSVTGFGIWGVMRSWKKQAEIQLKLDQCVGKKAKELQSLLGTLESSNQRMIWARRSAAAAVVLAPEALEAIRAELMIELALQEGIRLKWQGEGIAAVLGKNCDELRVLPIRYPLLEWSRLPPDAIGPQAFEWVAPHPEFNLLFKSSSHLSAATVSGGAKEKANGKNRWLARWASLY